jgi:hypothetical protein
MKNKKLTAKDIPSSYSYAAVDPNGKAFAFDLKPQNEGHQVIGWYCASFDGRIRFIGNGFDVTNWENSLIHNWQ